jgi:D-alanine-D-alanine ligase
VKIGVTYDLREDYLALGYDEAQTAEFDRPDTIEAIVQALQALGYQTDCIGNIISLAQRLVSGDRWDMVFNIAEGLRGFGREAQVPALLEAYDVPYTFSDPLVMSLTLHKGLTKRVIRDAGVPTPDFLVIEDVDQAEPVCFDPPYFVKPVAEGTGKGITAASIIRRREDLWPRCVELIEMHRQPVLVEEFLPGREFTVGLIGTGMDSAVLGSIELHLRAAAEPLVYSYENKENCEEFVEYRPADAAVDGAVKAAEVLALKAWRVLGCRDAGRIDIRCDALGNPQFMEVNPLAGLHREHSDLPIICSRIGMSYQMLIEKIMASARRRITSQLSTGVFGKRAASLRVATAGS